MGFLMVANNSETYMMAKKIEITFTKG